MKKIFSIFLAFVMLFVANAAYAAPPSRDLTSLYKVNPQILMDVGVDVSKTVYPIVIDFYDAFLIMGLGPNFHLDDVVILYLDNMYQLVNFKFPILYNQDSGVMAIFFSSGIWIRTGMILEDGSVTFDMTEVYGDEVEMFIFSNQVME